MSKRHMSKKSEIIVLVVHFIVQMNEDRGVEDINHNRNNQNKKADEQSS